MCGGECDSALKKTIYDVFKAVKAKVQKGAPGMNRLRAPAAIFR